MNHVLTTVNMRNCFSCTAACCFVTVKVLHVFLKWMLAFSSNTTVCDFSLSELLVCHLLLCFTFID